MIQSIYSALSGIRASILRQDVSAHNVANVTTSGFNPLRTLQTEVPGGGTAASVDFPESETQPIQPGGNVDSALAAELLQPSEVDLAQEMTQQILALRSLQANLPIIRAEDEMTRDLLDASRGKE